LINSEDAISTNDTFLTIASDSLFSFRNSFPLKTIHFENFNISEHNMIRVEMDPGTTGKVVLRLAKKSICQHFPMANFMYCCKMCYGLLFELGG